VENIKLIIESVRERDIDLLFLEEWNVNRHFCEWFINTMCGRVVKCSKNQAYHSIVADNLGETDLFLTYAENNHESIILLENKVDAIAQDKQGARYKKRANNLLSSGKYSSVNTCIIAPENYLKRDSEVQNYEYQISYEQVMEWFNRFIDSRSQYKAMLLKCAIEQERRGYIAKADTQVTMFWHDYWEQLRSKIPSAYMKEPFSIPSGSDWPVISFDWMPNNWILRHKLAMGVIDLETRLDEEVAKKILISIANTKIFIVKTGKSISLRLKIESLDRNKLLISQSNKLESAINALRIFESIGNDIIKEI